MWKLQLNTHKTETILFSKRHRPPSRPNSNPGHLCALGRGRQLSRPRARLQTALHPAPAHHHE